MGGKQQPISTTTKEPFKTEVNEKIRKWQHVAMSINCPIDLVPWLWFNGHS